MRSLYSGVTGLKTHQTKMDVIGNNIANVNTVAYKSANMTFETLFSNTLSHGSAATKEGTRNLIFKLKEILVELPEEDIYSKEEMEKALSLVIEVRDLWHEAYEKSIKEA